MGEHPVAGHGHEGFALSRLPGRIGGIEALHAARERSLPAGSGRFGSEAAAAVVHENGMPAGGLHEAARLRGDERRAPDHAAEGAFKKLHVHEAAFNSQQGLSGKDDRALGHGFHSALEAVLGEMIQKALIEKTHAAQGVDFLGGEIQIAHEGGGIVQAGENGVSPVFRRPAPHKLAADAALAAFGKKQAVGDGKIAHIDGGAAAGDGFPSGKRISERPAGRIKIQTQHTGYTPRARQQKKIPSWRGDSLSPANPEGRNAPFSQAGNAPASPAKRHSPHNQEKDGQKNGKKVPPFQSRAAGRVSRPSWPITSIFYPDNVTFACQFRRSLPRPAPGPPFDIESLLVSCQ